jgi:hypothetical protein
VRELGRGDLDRLRLEHGLDRARRSRFLLAEELLEPAQRVAQLPAPEDLAQLRAVWLLGGALRQVDVDRLVAD